MGERQKHWREASAENREKSRVWQKVRNDRRTAKARDKRQRELAQQTGCGSSEPVMTDVTSSSHGES